MDDGSSGGVSLYDAIVVIKGDAAQRRNEKSDSSRIIENQIDRICGTLVLDDDYGSTLVRFSLGKKGHGGGPSRHGDVGIGMIEPLDERAGELYE